MVQHVDRFSAELDSLPFLDREAFERRRVKLLQARSGVGAYLAVAEGAGCGLRQAGRAQELVAGDARVGGFLRAQDDRLAAAVSAREAGKARA